MLWRKAIILLREFRVAWLAGSLANSSSYILNSNPLCSSKRSLVAASRCTSIGIFLLYACPGGILCTLPDSADQQFLDFRASQWPLCGMGCTALVLADPSVHRCIGEGPLRRGHDCHSDGHPLGLPLGLQHA